MQKFQPYSNFQLRIYLHISFGSSFSRFSFGLIKQYLNYISVYYLISDKLTIGKKDLRALDKENILRTVEHFKTERQRIKAGIKTGKYK